MNAVWLLALVAVVSAQTPPRPEIPSEYLAEVQFHEEGHNRTFMGEGHIAHDQAGQRAVDHMEVHESGGHPEMLTLLWRYDTHTEYMVQGGPNSSHCEKHELNGTIPNRFAWVAQATYAGKHEVPGHHEELEMWQMKNGAMTMELGVSSDDRNVPVVEMERGARGMIMRHYMAFHAGTPPSTLFDVPHQCQ